MEPAQASDAARPKPDASDDRDSGRRDAEPPELDADEPTTDAGEPERDAREPEPDASTPDASERDAESADASTPVADASAPDASTPDASQPDAQPPALRYSTDIAPILAEHCLLCHVSGGAGPFSLSDYGEVSIYADDIQRVTFERVMPPCDQLGEPCGLSDAQITRITQWVQAGAPR